MQSTLSIATRGPGLYEVTREVAAWVAGGPAGPAAGNWADRNLYVFSTEWTLGVNKLPSGGKN